MKTKLMQRIYSAIINGEDPILDQLEHDLNQARLDGSLYTNEYSIRSYSDNVLSIKDKMNNQITIATFSDNDIQLSPANSKLAPGTPVSWIDGEGSTHYGVLVSINGDKSDVKSGDKIISVSTMLLNSSDKLSKTFTKKRASMFLVDEKGNLMGYGWLQSLMTLKKSHPKWKLITNYDWNAVNNGIKNIKQFSDSAQRMFTRSYRRYAVVDKSGKLIGIFDITNAKGIVAKTPGSTAIKEKEWNKLNQPKIKGFSNQVITDNNKFKLK